MEYLTGYTVKPYEITNTGVVLFTDGTNNEILPNQLQCEAYGYTYDSASGTCVAFRLNTNLQENINNINNKINGANNTTQRGVNTVQINGSTNTLRGNNNNCLINGTGNEIANGVNNSFVGGRRAEATADQSIVLGGNCSGVTFAGYKQSVQLMYGTRTTDGTNTVSYLNNCSPSLFAIPENTIMYFHADVVAVRIGGSAGEGAVGDFASWVERGVVINKSGSMTISRERDDIKSSGETGNWRPTGITSGENFAMRVRGDTNMNIEWLSNITFTQIKTGVSL
tara:strand:+ start:22089 stop:22934 length:846 start_codon:yes stop_codon:yes gene_type:complete